MLKQAWQHKARQTSEFTRCVQKCRESPRLMCLHVSAFVTVKCRETARRTAMVRAEADTLHEHLAASVEACTGGLGQARKRCTVKSADGLQTGTLCNVYGSTSNGGKF